MHQILNTIEEQIPLFEKIKERYMTDLLAYYHAQMSGTDEEKEIYHIEAEKSRSVINDFLHSSYIALLESVVGEMSKMINNKDWVYYPDGSRGPRLIRLEEFVSTLEAVINKLKQ